eukprot:scaffold21803_cov73-Skeletonema_marinoi.AAC.1
MGAKSDRIAYLLLATLLTQGACAKQAFSSHATFSTATRRTSAIDLSPSSIMQRENVVDESFDGEECDK